MNKKTATNFENNLKLFLVFHVECYTIKTDLIRHYILPNSTALKH